MDIKIFAIACLVFLILDGIWLTFNNKYYSNLTYKIQKEPLIIKPLIIPVVYIFLFTSLYFCIRLIELELKFNNKNKDYVKIITISCIYGIAIYGIYSYTTCIFFNNYNYTNAIIDTLWSIPLYTIPTIIYFSLK
jgi:uncharacterized membrane protein